MLGPLARNIRTQASALVRSVGLQRFYGTATGEQNKETTEQTVPGGAVPQNLVIRPVEQSESDQEESDLLLRGTVQPGCVLNSVLKPASFGKQEYFVPREDKADSTPTKQANQSRRRHAVATPRLVEGSGVVQLIIDEPLNERLLQVAAEGKDDLLRDYAVKLVQGDTSGSTIRKYIAFLSLHAHELTAQQVQIVADAAISGLTEGSSGVPSEEVFRLAALCQQRVGASEGLRILGALLDINYQFPLYRSHLELVTVPISEALERMHQAGILEPSAIHKVCRDLVAAVAVLQRISVGRASARKNAQALHLKQNLAHFENWKQHQQFLRKLKGETQTENVSEMPDLDQEYRMYQAEYASLAATRPPLTSQATLQAFDVLAPHPADVSGELDLQLQVSKARSALSQGSLAKALNKIIKLSKSDVTLRNSLATILKPYFESINQELLSELPELTEAYFFCADTIESVFFEYPSHVDNHNCQVLVNGDRVLQLTDHFVQYSQAGKQVIIEAARSFFKKTASNQGVPYTITASEADLVIIVDRLSNLLTQATAFEHFKSDNHLLTLCAAELAANSKNLPILSSLSLQAGKYIMGETFERFYHGLVVEMLKANKDNGSHQDVLSSLKRFLNITLFKSLDQTQRLNLLAGHLHYDNPGNGVTSEAFVWQLPNYKLAKSISSEHPFYTRELQGIPKFTLYAGGVAPILEGRYEQGLSFLLEHIINNALTETITQSMTRLYALRCDFETNGYDSPHTQESIEQVIREFQEDLVANLEAGDFKKLYNNLYTNTWRDEEFSKSAKAVLLGSYDYFGSSLSSGVKEILKSVYRSQAPVETQNTAKPAKAIEGGEAVAATDTAPAAEEGEKKEEAAATETPAEIPVLEEEETDDGAAKKRKKKSVTKRTYFQLNPRQIETAQKVESIKSMLLEDDDLPPRQLSANYTNVLYGIRARNYFQDIDQEEAPEMRTVEEYFLKHCGSSPFPNILKPQLPQYHWFCETLLDIAITQQNTDLLVVGECLSGIAQPVLNPVLKKRYVEFKQSLTQSAKKAQEYAASVERLPVFVDYSFVERDLQGVKQRVSAPKQKVVGIVNRMFENLLEEQTRQERAAAISKTSKLGL